MILPIVDAAAGDDRFRIGIEEPAIDINLMRAKVDYRSAAEVLIPSPVFKLMHRFKAILLQRFVVDNSFFREAEVFTGGLASVPLAVNGSYTV